MNGTDRMIRVTGTATVSAKADVTRIRMTVNGTDMEYEGAIHRCAENHRDMRDRLESVGLDRDGLRTESQKVEPHYEDVPYEDHEGRQRTKRVRQGFEYRDVLVFEFPTDNETLGRMLTTVLKAPCKPQSLQREDEAAPLRPFLVIIRDEWMAREYPGKRCLLQTKRERNHLIPLILRRIGIHPDSLRDKLLRIDLGDDHISTKERCAGCKERTILRDKIAADEDHVSCALTI